MKDPFVSIIIPVKEYNENLQECVDKCLALDYNFYEIIVLPDGDIDIKFSSPKVRVISTEGVGPAEKRDIGINNSKGEIIAFIDDDAHPRRDWLKNAVSFFANEEVGAVGGPGVTPSDDDIYQKASGSVFSSFLASGKYTYRYLPKEQREIDDYPSCNFLVRRSIMKEIGGFANTFWPGEDTVLCLKITKELNKKIIYSPNILVYHHRRQLFKEHLKQVARYALHRGFFVKKFPDTSLKFSYFIPSIFVVCLVLGFITSLFFKTLLIIYILILGIYFFLLMKESVKFKNILVSPGIFLTHITYGIYFFKGLLSSKIK